MKLEYNILWIDNDIPEYIENGEVGKIREFLIELGFEANIITIEDELKLNEYIFLHKYDLIISDFNLNNTTGDVIIEKIRIEKGLSTEILFYTAKSNFRDNPEVQKRLSFMDRINFHSNRDTFLEKVEKLIELTLDKLLELNATRGLITAATSELDVEIENLYNLIIEMPIEDQLKHKVEKIFKTDYKEIKKNYIKKCKEQRDAHITDYKLYFSKSEAFRRWDILKELLALKVPAGFDLELFKKYNLEVIDIRNKLAHAKAEEKNGKMILKGQFGKLDFEYDRDGCVQIRKNLINHRRNIYSLKESLTTKPDSK